MTGDRTFDALSSPVRRRILAYLSKTSLTSSEIADRFEMTKPAISKHLGDPGERRARGLGEEGPVRALQPRP